MRIGQGVLLIVTRQRSSNTYFYNFFSGPPYNYNINGPADGWEMGQQVQLGDVYQESTQSYPQGSEMVQAVDEFGNNIAIAYVVTNSFLPMSTAPVKCEDDVQEENKSAENPDWLGAVEECVTVQNVDQEMEKPDDEKEQIRVYKVKNGKKIKRQERPKSVKGQKTLKELRKTKRRPPERSSSIQTRPKRRGEKKQKEKRKVGKKVKVLDKAFPKPSCLSKIEFESE